MIYNSYNYDDDKELLRQYGFDVDTKGCILFIDLINSLKPLFGEHKSIDEIRKVLPDYYLEEWHFVQEIGMKKYEELLRKFCTSRKITKLNRQDKIVEPLLKISVDDTVLYFSELFYRRSNPESKYEDKKVFVYGNNECKLKTVK